MYLDLLGLIALLIFSAFSSAAELAFVVSNKIKIEIRARKNNLAAKKALYFLKHPQYFFSTILIMNNIINIAFASISTLFLYSAFALSEGEILLVSTVAILLFGELIPKYFAREFADTVIMLSVIPIRFISIILYPLVKITSSISAILTRSENQNEEHISYLFGKEDMQSLLDESSEAGNVDEDDSDVINKVFELGEQKVYEAMTPRTDIVGVEINSSIDEVINTFIESGYSKIPVYEESLDNIKGIVLTYDMFKSPESLKSVMREVVFVPETKKTLETLNELLEKRLSIAIVVDEFGGTAGLVTVEDIIEEMLGEIRDEYDEEEEVLKKIDDNSYVISGRVEIDRINEEFELNIPEGDYETIGGFIITHIGRIPTRGEFIEIPPYKIQVLYADKTKIDLVKVFVDPNDLIED
ncbi:MAG: hemolysin family protein [Melioribacteraceae bacterium]|nr:hemolysin family protein [Melioribacteraceae bacterium]